MARLRMTDLVSLFRRMGVSLRAGVDILRVCATEAQRGSPLQQRHMGEIHDRLRRGDTLSEAFEGSGEVFPPLARQMVRVGDQTGHLDAVFLRISEHYQHLLQLRRDFLAGVSWPLTQLMFAVLIVGLLIWIMGFLPGDVDILGWNLTGTSGLIIYICIVGAMAGAGALGVYSLARGMWGTAPVLVAMKVPVVGRFLESLSLAHFAWSLGLTIDAGMDARESLRLALRSTHNPLYIAQEATCDRVVAGGGEFHEALEAAGVFPRELVETLQAADLAGTQSETLAHLSRDYEERAKDAARTLAYVSAGAVRVAVGLLLVWLIFRVARVYLGTINDALRMSL